MQDIITYLAGFSEVRFLGAGGVSTLLYYAIFTPLIRRHTDRYLMCSGVAFAVTFVVGFPLQKFWAFADPGMTAIETEGALFFAKELGLFGLNALFLYLLVDRMRFHPLWAQVGISAPLGAPSYFLTRWILMT
ncbi:GtrA family protein [Candidatus Kaiserbacteria bacterium]|nr:GtrA family protein [Candidatus Kaiserbacteria bacterium]